MCICTYICYKCNSSACRCPIENFEHTIQGPEYCVIDFCRIDNRDMQILYRYWFNILPKRKFFLLIWVWFNLIIFVEGGRRWSHISVCSLRFVALEKLYYTYNDDVLYWFTELIRCDCLANDLNIFIIH